MPTTERRHDTLQRAVNMVDVVTSRLGGGRGVVAVRVARLLFLVLLPVSELLMLG